MKPLIGVAVITTATLLIAQDPPPGAAVEGTVVNSATGAGIDEASVVFFGNQSNRYNAKTDAVGYFKIIGMAPGNYRANVEKDGYAPPAFDLASFLLNPGLHVAAGPDPVKVELKLAPLGTIRGRVFGPDGKPAAGIEVSVFPNITADMSVTDEEGRFTLENNRPGSYTLIARPLKSDGPVEAKDGTRTAIVTTYYPSVANQSLAQKITFRGEGDSYEIRMQTAPVHRVRGIVLDEEGKQLPGAELTLLPAPEGRLGPMGLGGRGALFLCDGFAAGSGRRALRDG